MTSLTVISVVGLPDVPTTSRGVRDRLKRLCIATTTVGQTFTFQLSDLPAPVRAAWEAREIERLNLPYGTRDEDAHGELLAAPATMRAEAKRKAGIVRVMEAARLAGLDGKGIHATVWERFGREGHSKATLDRWHRKVRGVDVANYAPAQLDRYTGNTSEAPMADEAWALWQGLVKGAFETHRLIAVYHDVAGIAAQKG